MVDRWPVQMPVRMRIEQPAPVQHVDTLWCYQPQRPWELAVDFSDPGRRNVWVFARDLLAAGLSGPAGVGDVQIQPHAGRVQLRLMGEERVLVLSARRKDLYRFLDRSYRWVPAGDEAGFMDVDETISMLTGGDLC